MNKIISALAGALLTLVASDCRCLELRVSLRLDPISALQFESVTAFVSILNDGEGTFIFDDSDEKNKIRIFFMVERKMDYPVKRIDDRPPLKRMKLEPGEKQEFIADVSAFHDMGAPGRYVVRAAVEVGKTRFESNPVVMDVVRGIEIGSVTRAVPSYPDRDRTYSLRYWTRDKREILFLCVDEDGGKTSYGVFALGTLLRMMKPSIEVDRQGNVVVYHQTNRACFIRSKFESNMDGVFFIDQSYLDSKGQPYQYLREPKTVNAPSK